MAALRQSHTLRNSMHSLHSPNTPSPLTSSPPVRPLPTPTPTPMASPSPVPIPGTPLGLSFTSVGFSTAGAFGSTGFSLIRKDTATRERERERDRDRESVAASWGASARSRAASPMGDGRASPFVFLQAGDREYEYGYNVACNGGSGVLIEEMESPRDGYFGARLQKGPGAKYDSGKVSGSAPGSAREGARSPSLSSPPLLSPPISPPLSPPLSPEPNDSGRSSPLHPQSDQQPAKHPMPHLIPRPAPNRPPQPLKLREDDTDLDLLYVDKSRYVEEDQSDAPWARYKPTIRPGSIHGIIPEDDSVSLLRSKMYEILDDRSYAQQMYFLQCEYGKLPLRPHIPVTLDGEHSSKAQVLFGIGHHATVPAVFWSSQQYFVRAVYSLARAYDLSPAIIYAHTARIRRDMTYLGAFVGWLPLDFGVWRGKNDLDPQRAEYIDQSFPGVDDSWAFWYPTWSMEVLTKEGVTNISFGPAPSPRPTYTPLPPPDDDEKAPKMSLGSKLKRRASGCHTQ